MRIISRYVLREHVGPLVFSMSALTSLLLLNYIAKQLPNLVGKGLPWTVVVEFISLSLPFTIAMTLPMAVLVATLHAFSRLAADSEVTAFKASGLALPRLMLPIVISGVVLSLVMVWFNDQVMPAANYRLQTLMNDIARKKPTFALRPQVINEVQPMKIFLRAARLEAGSSEMRDVTIFDFSDGSRRRTIRADSGQVQLSPDGRDLILALQHGHTTEVTRTEPQRLQRVFFNTSSVRIRNIGNELERNTAGGEKSDRERTVCELHAQLVAAVRQRDSLVVRIKSLDSTASRYIGAQTAARGTGTIYCRLRRMLMTRVAHAAVLPVVAQDSGRAGVTITPQGEVQDPARKPVLPAPSSGIRLPQVETPDPSEIPVLLEGMKLQLLGAQSLINGNQVEIEKKFAIATACAIFALLGAPVAFRFPRGGVGLTIGVSLVVFGVYYCGLIVGEEFARRGYLPAFIAMWGTNLMLLIIGVVLTARLGTEGTTHRGSEMSDRILRLVERVRRRPGTDVPAY